MKKLLLILFLLALAAPAFGGQTPTMTSVIVNQTNQHRKNHNLKPLVENAALTKIAQEHSLEMARKHRASHDGIEGRLAKTLKLIPGSKGMGENVAWNKNVKNPPQWTVDFWKRSKVHNENLLHPQFTMIGVGIARGTDGAYYFTQLFAY